METSAMTAEPTTHQYQPLQMNQRSGDRIYQNVANPKQPESEYELVQVSVTNVHTQQPNVYQSLKKAQIHEDEIRQELATQKAGSDINDIKAAMKKTKIMLLVTVTINILVLLLIIALAILGGIQIQSTMTASTSQINELRTSTKEDVQDIINNVSQLTIETYNNISLVSLQLSDTNYNITSALNQLDTNQGHITTQLDAAYSNITSVQTQLINLQMNVTSLQIQVGSIQLYCGPGVWHRVAYLNMSNPSQQCPSAWREYSTSGVRACGRPVTSGGSCAGVSYSNNNEQYSRVCGRAIGYQIGSTDAFGWYARGNTIDSSYVYGVSFTHGSPRTHIWTLAAGAIESGSSLSCCNCPCITPPGPAAPSFIGSNFYCESGNSANSYVSGHLYSEDPLWDGEQCEGQCCSNGKSPPWFSVELPNPTSDDIEVRICCGEGTNLDDVLIQLLEIYVQ